MRYSLKSVAEFIAAFLAVILFVAAAIVWRLSSSPINSTFLTPYIESGIERYIAGAHAQIDHTLLTWDNADHSMALHVDGVTIKYADSKKIAEIPSLDIKLSLLAMFVGQFWPIELTIDHPQLKLVRHADGKLYFADMSTQGADVGEQDNGRDVLKTTMYNLTHAYAMRHLTVYRAALAIHDDATNRDWSVSVPEISLMRTFTQLVGTAKIDLTQKAQPATLEVHYAYDHVRELHRVSTRFNEITPAQLVGGHPETLGLNEASIFDLPISGEMEIAFDPDLKLSAAAVTLHGGKGLLKAPDFWDKPRSVESFDVEGDFDRKVHRLNVATASLDFGGPKLNLTASGHAPALPKNADLDFTMKAKLDNWPMDAFADLWPKPIIPNARAWMVANLSRGSYDKGEATFNGSLLWDDLANMTVTSGQGKITASHGTVLYIQGMPPVEDVKVESEFDLQKMSLSISEGGIGALRLEPFTAVITGLSDNNQFIDIPLRVAGPIPDVIKLIDHPPLRYATVVGLTPDSLSGTIEGVVNLHLPMIKTLSTQDIEVNSTSKMFNAASSKLVKGMDISQGDLTLDLNKEGLTIKGSAALNKIPVDLTMQQSFHALNGKPMRQLDLSGNVKGDQWKVFGDTFAGTNGFASFNLHLQELTKGKADFSGGMDFTSSDLHFVPLNWKKSVNVPAVLQFKGAVAEGRDIVIKTLSLRGPQAFAQGSAVVGTDGSVRSINLEPLKLGRTSADIYFNQLEEEGGSLRFVARGKALDVSGLKGGKDPARADPRPKEYRLNVDKLYTSDNGVVLNASGYAVRDGEGWKEISLHGLADGEHKLAIELKPKEDGTSSFVITCDDFGKMLKGLGMTDTVKEGHVNIEGESTVEHPRVIEGKAEIGSFTAGKLPVLALLLNATSPFGFTGLITDSASFEHMNGEFRWSGDEIELLHMNAAGASVGLNIAGKVDMNSGRANLHGTLVPFSMVNRILGAIPLLGDLLTGGDGGGVLAVSYRIKGPLADPSVNVNPVSLLTPGFLRNLFFGGGDNEIPPEEPVPEAEVP